MLISKATIILINKLNFDDTIKKKFYTTIYKTKKKKTRSKIGAHGIQFFSCIMCLTLFASAIAILSRLQIEQLSAFLGTEQLIKNSICHLISDNSILFEVKASAVACNFLRMLYLCCCHLVFKETSVEPMYLLSLTVALYTPFKF